MKSRFGKFVERALLTGLLKQIVLIGLSEEYNKLCGVDAYYQYVSLICPKKSTMSVLLHENITSKLQYFGQLVKSSVEKTDDAGKE